MPTLDNSKYSESGKKKFLTYSKRVLTKALREALDGFGIPAKVSAEFQCITGKPLAPIVFVVSPAARSKLDFHLTFVVDGNLIFKVEYTGPKPKPFNNSTELFFREKNRKDVKIEEFAAAVYEQNQETWTAWHNTAHRLVNECTEFDRNIVGVMEKFAPTIASLYGEFERVL